MNKIYSILTHDMSDDIRNVLVKGFPLEGYKALDKFVLALLIPSDATELTVLQLINCMRHSMYADIIKDLDPVNTYDVLDNLTEVYPARDLATLGKNLGQLKLSWYSDELRVSAADTIDLCDFLTLHIINYCRRNGL